ncbi:hypothetical protein FKP32DRAFT_1240629 [Trametes sanguinea]|nr:hypothetical protein FKP32DRAFT_1240629 [Trametes sanguinea]
MRRDGSSNSTGICTDISGAWLLDPAVSSKAGMVVTVHGSRTLQHGVAWHGGDYEGARGVVLSVHNTGSDDEFFPSTARVKFFKPLNPAVDTFAVPVSLLWPVRPEAEGEHALIIGGPYKGNEARLLEEYRARAELELSWWRMQYTAQCTSQNCPVR